MYSPRIIEFKGEHNDGLLLEYAPNGSLERYLQDSQVSIREKIRFAKETAEGVAYVHQRKILICDIHIRNILLDAELHIKLCDFQGRLLGPSGEVIVSGGACENAESFMPRSDKGFADVTTDLFALGSTIYHIIIGHRPFPQYVSIPSTMKPYLRTFTEKVTFHLWMQNQGVKEFGIAGKANTSLRAKLWTIFRL